MTEGSDGTPNCHTYSTKNNCPSTCPNVCPH
jgi:hypothetical protein